MAHRFVLARELARLSVGQAAKLLGISRCDLESLECPGPAHALNVVCKMAEVYSVNVPWLIGEAPLMIPEEQLERTSGSKIAKIDRERIRTILAATQERK